MLDSFLRQQARTRRFSLGVPRRFSVSADGSSVAFVRSEGGSDPSSALWALDVASGEERRISAPPQGAAGAGSGGAGSDEPSAAERAARERRREHATGVTTYSADDAHTAAVYALAGELWIAPMGPGGSPERLEVPGPVFDPHLDRSGRTVAWCRVGEASAAQLWVCDAEPARAVASARMVAGDVDPAIAWGVAEFAAAEEMGRESGFWWSPDSDALLVTRVDESAIPTWWISDPGDPAALPAPRRYPAAGGPDADVSLWLVGLGANGSSPEPAELAWDRATFPYLVSVDWSAGHSPLALVESRDHHHAALIELGVDGASVLATMDDPAWVWWPAGLPRRLADGRALWALDIDDTVSLSAVAPSGGDSGDSGDSGARGLGGRVEVLTPPGLQVRSVVHSGEAGVVFTASSDPTEVELWRWQEGTLRRLDAGGVVATAAAGLSTVVVARRSMATHGQRAHVQREDGSEISIRDLAETPVVEPGVRMMTVGALGLRVGVVMPSAHAPGTRLPVLALPYGGPAAQKVMAERRSWLEAQWWADQGFAVVVADGRGSPGRGRAWERHIHRDLAGPVLEDQVTAISEAVASDPDLDDSRVGICGWSFGGYLAALAVLRRPDVFHAAVAGAPVTDWRLYDTYYSERYLGHPGTDPAPYDQCSLIADCPRLKRPLLLVHGLADDNVYFAHTIRLSAALLEQGCEHSVLPLSGITHMASRPEVAENLAMAQARFLLRALG